MGSGRIRRARVEIEGKDELSPAAKKAESGITRLAKSINLKLIASVAGATLALRKLTRFIGESVSASARQEAAYNGLRDALSSLGPAADGVTRSLAAQAAELQKVSTFGDEQILEAQALIGSFVKEEEQIKAATKATLDLAAAKKIELTVAADLVSKTLGSTTNALSRYGIAVEGAVGSTERLTALTGSIGQVFGGRAAGEVDTFRGAVSQLSNAYGDFQEELGNALTKSEEVREGLKRLTAFFSDPATISAVVGFAQKIVAGLTRIANAFDFLTRKAGEFENWVKGTSKVVAANWEGQAKRMGISVDELRKRVNGTIEANRELSLSTAEVNDRLGIATEKTVRASAATATNAEENKKAAEEKGENAVVTRDLTESVIFETEAMMQNTAATRANVQETVRLVQEKQRLEVQEQRVAEAQRRETFARNAITGDRSSFAQIGGGSFSTSTPTILPPGSTQRTN